MHVRRSIKRFDYSRYSHTSPHKILSLCFEDINLQDNEELKFILKIVNLVFAVLFTVEMFLKWIAFGLNKYFSSVWTCLDFIIVLVYRIYFYTLHTHASQCETSEPGSDVYETNGGRCFR